MTAVRMIPYPRQLADLAAADPGHLAVTDETRTVTRAELERLAIDTAEVFARLGVRRCRRGCPSASSTGSSSSRSRQ
jgi:hypothetical protein